MRRNHALTRITCSGIVDADNYQPDDAEYLQQLGISILPFSEIENLILLPAVSRAIAESESFVDPELSERLASLRRAIFETLNSPALIDVVVTRYCRRRIDRILKKIDLSASRSVAEITAEYNRQTTALNIVEIAQQAKERIERAIREDDLPGLLAIYDNKQLMALAASHLKAVRLPQFQSWLVRALGNNTLPALTVAMRAALPTIQPL